MIWGALICLLPTWIHIFNDRNGDNKKLNDIIVLTLVSGVIAWANHRLFDLDWFRSIALIFGYHTLLFDYCIVWILRRNGVISSNAKVWSYTGKSSRIDQFVAKIPPLLRFIIRVAVFAGCLYIFIA